MSIGDKRLLKYKNIEQEENSISVLLKKDDFCIPSGRLNTMDGKGHSGQVSSITVQWFTATVVSFQN